MVNSQEHDEQEEQMNITIIQDKNMKTNLMIIDMKKSMNTKHNEYDRLMNMMNFGTLMDIGGTQ